MNVTPEDYREMAYKHRRLCWENVEDERVFSSLKSSAEQVRRRGADATADLLP